MTHHALAFFRSARSIALRVLLLALVAVAIQPAAARQATPTPRDAVAGAAAWLLGQQADDGGFVGFAEGSDPGTTVDAVIALSAARNAGVEIDLAPALRFLEANALVYAQSGPGPAAKLALAFVAAGENPRDIGGVDPVAICEQVATNEGLWGTGVYDHATIMLALQAAGSEVPEGAASALRPAQNIDGSWAFDGSVGEGTGDTNTTAMVIQALVASGHGQDIMVLQAVRYVRGAQTADGGFPYQPGAEAVADANSTALSLQALIAAGEDPASADWRDVRTRLRAFQNPTGGLRYQDEIPDDNLFATVQALPALADQPLPVIAVPAATATPTA
jgi:hypothetical protein